MIHFRNGPKQLQLENSRCAMGLTFQDQEGKKNNHKTKKNNNKTHTLPPRGNKQWQRSSGVGGLCLAVSERERN